jgi:thioredoxin-like negative regulator of GroEL
MATKTGPSNCAEQLKESGDASVMAMDTMLEHLGVPEPSTVRSNPLAEASRLRLQGEFAAAESILEPLLAQNPANVDAAMLLIRLYAQDLRRLDLATGILTALEQQPYVSRDHVEFARRSIGEWSQGKPSHDEPGPKKTGAQAVTIDELIEQRRFGTALEILEHQTGEHPEDFDAWLKFAEVHAVHCGHVNRAEKIIREIETNPAFSPEQKQLTKTKLKEWREAGLQQS